MTRGSVPDCSVLVVCDLHEVALADAPSWAGANPCCRGWRTYCARTGRSRAGCSGR